MKGKAALVVGAAVGYVLGSKAGRERYDQLKAQAESLWTDPKVQEKVSQAKDSATEVAAQAKQKAAEKTSSTGSHTSNSSTTGSSTLDG